MINNIKKTLNIKIINKNISYKKYIIFLFYTVSLFYILNLVKNILTRVEYIKLFYYTDISINYILILINKN